MQPFISLDGLVLPIDRPNVDTDAILPKQYMKLIKRTGFGSYLFDDWRYLDSAEPDDDRLKRRVNPDFVMNQPRYQGSSILLGRVNFGCGSSREHAVWALKGSGIRALIAPSFGEIFRGNCLKNGVLPVVLPEPVIESLFVAVQSEPGYRLFVDLPAQVVREPRGMSHLFAIDSLSKSMMLQGLDEIGVTLGYAAEIETFERQRLALEPWLNKGMETLP